MASKVNVDKIARGSGSPEFTIPTADGSANQFLKTDGSGVLSFDTVTTTALTGSTNTWIPTITGANALTGTANFTYDGNTLDVKNSGTASSINLYCETGNAHYIKLKSGPHASATSYTLTLPNAPPSVSGQALTATDAGVGSWATISSGTLVNVVQTQDYTGAINVDGVTSYATAGSDFLVSITPTSTSSTVLIMAGSAIGGIDGDTSYAGELKIYRQIASGGYASITASPVAHINGASGKRRPWTFMYLDSPSTTSQVDYQLYMRASDNAVVHFAVDGFSRFITALEIGA